MSKITKHENGVGNIFIISIIVLVLIIAGVIIWQVTKKSSNSNTTSSTTNTASTTNTNVSSACLKVFSDRTLCSFAEHTDIDTIAYTASGTAVEGSTGKGVTFTVEHDTKNNTFLTYSVNGQQISVINFNSITYVQDGTGATWLEYTNASAAAAAGIPNPVGNFELKFNSGTGNGYTAIKDGKATCGKLECYKYQVKVASSPDKTQYVWFDTKDYLLREYSYSDSSTGTSANITFVYGGVTIAAPSPVQVVS
jgi:cytoskeletal protein RodZ